MAGRPKGAQNKDKPFRDALRMEIAALQAEDDQKGLREIAKVLIAKAVAGEGWAIAELGNRLDGRPTQAIAGDDEAPPVRIDAIRRVIVDPKQPGDSEPAGSAEPD